VKNVRHPARRWLERAHRDPLRAFRDIWRAARVVLGFIRGLFFYPIAWFGASRPPDPLAAEVAKLLLVGFYGKSDWSFSARLLARQIRSGQIGGVFFVSQNVGSRDDVSRLLDLFRSGDAHPLIAIDHEGGIVQRLTKRHGMTPLPAARTIAAQATVDHARELYCKAGLELAALGFNVNLGPVLDHDNPANPAIGRPMRAYSTDPQRIAAFGAAFVGGFSRAGILCAAKHFPGHGNAVEDSHYGVADISDSWTKAEMEPFIRLLAAPECPPMVMTGHLRLKSVSPDGWPATIAKPVVTGLLREDLGYHGVVVTDDIDMDAVRHVMNRADAFVQAIAAGNDLIMIKNLFGYDPMIPQHAVRWVRKAIARGILTEAQVTAAAERVRKIRNQARVSHASTSRTTA
jgi:beta-N-acetylhexosaminidase